MKRLYFLTLPLTLLGPAPACAVDDDPPAVCEPACTPFEPLFPEVGACVDGSCSPTFHACFESDEYSTCRDQCEALGSTCVADGCADGTYLIQSHLEQCEDPAALGVVVSRTCDETIEFQGNTAARCCCEQNP